MVILVIPVIFGVIGGFWANAKGLNVALWAIVCGLLPIVGLIILAFQKSAKA